MNATFKAAVAALVLAVVFARSVDAVMDRARPVMSLGSNMRDGWTRLTNRSTQHPRRESMAALTAAAGLLLCHL